MRAYITWMSGRPILNLFLVLLYYVLVVLPHKKFGSFLNDVVFQGITRDQYNLYVAIIAFLVLGLYAWVFVKKSIQCPDKDKLWIYMLLNVFLAILIVNMLFVINIEVIHFPQYAGFALLIFPLIRSYTSTLIWTTIAGAIDEAYQNFYLAPQDTGYYDWNDVLTNLVGAVFGLLLIRSFKIEDRSHRPWYRSSGIIGLMAMFGIVGILWMMGILSIYPSETVPYQLVSKEISGFWSTVAPNVTYHIVRPVEGIVLMFLLFLVYSRIGK